MAGSRRAAVFNSRWFWLMALALAAAPFVAEFNARLVVSRQLVEEEARLKREIEAEQNRAALLESYEQHVKSDAYVEWWARVQARMVKPGEIAVVPQTPADQAESIGAGGLPPLARDYAVEWWAAFFGELP